MGQYKVPQNVEAEDHILGPLTFKQFTYAMMGFGWAAISFAIFRTIPAILIIVGFPPTMLLLLLAFYNRDGQNFEQVLLAMVGFFAASRKRLWVKQEVAETFFITPTAVAAEITQRNPNEVHSELEKVAHLIDSRGWNEPPQVQNPNTQLSTSHEDRIVAPPAPKAPEAPAVDILDLQQSPLAQNLAELLREAASDVRVEAMNQMNQTNARGAAAPVTSIRGVTAQQPGDIIKLATQSDDLTVAQVAAQATRMAPAPVGQIVGVQPSGS